MDALLQALKNPAAMSGAQWLMLGIIICVLLGSAYLVYRLYCTFEEERRSRYVPNIGRKRLEAERQRQGKAAPGSDEGQGGAG